MPDAIITSTASTFGTISGTFAADQSTIVGTVAGSIVGTLTGSVGVPGPVGPAGPGSTWGGIVGTISDQTDLWTQLGLKAPLASPVFTGDARAVTAALGDNDTSIATTAFVQQELLSGTANARNLEVYVRNQTGSTIPAGSIVYINGATGNRPTITLAQANNDANSAQTFGFVKTSIANNGFGFVIVRGELENINTSGLTEGVQLYLSPTTPGTWTTTKPSAPQHLVYVGIVVRAHPTQGVILVAVQNGYEVGEIHDIQLGTLANNDLLAYESSSDLWKNKTFGALGLLTSADLTGYATESWVTSQGYITSSALTPYLTKADNLASVASPSSARDNLGLGSLNTPTFAGVNVPGSGTSVANLGATFLTINQQGSGQFTIQPSQGIVFPNGSIQTTAYTGAAPGYITSVSSPLSVSSGDLSIDLSSYLTSATAASTYYPLTGNPSGFITSSALSPYLTSATAASTYQTLSGMSAYLTTSAAASSYYPLTGNPSGFITSSALTGYATESWVTSGFYPLTGNPSGFIDASYLTGYAALTGADFTGRVTIASVSGGPPNFNIGTATGASGYSPVSGDIWLDAITGLNFYLGSTETVATQTFVTSQGFLTDAPSDGNQYARKNGAWDVVSAGTSYITSVSSPLSVSSGDLSIDLSSYLTSATAASTYYPLTGNPSGFITSSALTGYATESFVTSQGYITSSALTPYLTSATAASTYQTLSGMSSYLTTSAAASTYYPLTGNPSGFITSAALSTYAPLASPSLTGNVSIVSNSTGAALFIEQAGTGNILTLHDQAADTTFVAIDQNGKVNTIASTTTNAGFNVPHGTAPTSPVNGDLFTTTSGLFARINGTTRQYVDFDGTQTINGAKTFSNASQTLGNSTAAGTINVGTGATISGSTKTVNVGTGGAAGSFTNIVIGSTTGTSGTTLQGNLETTGTNVNIGNTNATQSINIGTIATLSGNTKTINVGGGGVSGSTSNISIGSSIAGVNSTTTLQGTTNGVTVAADTNSVALATTAYVVGQAGSATPLVNGTAAVGTSLRYARQDHVHGTDTTRAPLASPTFTGTPAATTAAVDTNTTQIATTAFVVGQGYLKSATAASTYQTISGMSSYLTTATAASTYQTISGMSSYLTTASAASTYAPLASPALTGTPTAPTATSGTNTTQLATTAFVQAAVSAGSGAVWGSITGTLSSQTDLQSALDAKLSTATASSTYAPLASPTFTGTVTIPSGASISGYATTASLASYAPLASPALTGTPTSTTAAVDTNTTQIATTAYVVGQGYLKSATASTTYAPLASPTFTGTPAAPTATAGTNTTQLATTAFVTTADNLKANLASPAFTGTPTAPTATAGTDTTQIATTAFVRADNNVKAWVNFNGTGTVAVRASFNVSSITDNGTGSYTVNFTTALADANYCPVLNGPAATATDVASTGTLAAVNLAAGSCRIDCETGNGTPVQADFELVNAAFIR